MKTIHCPHCSIKLVFNFMVFTQHLAKHEIDYATVKSLWDIAKAVKQVA